MLAYILLAVFASAVPNVATVAYRPGCFDDVPTPATLAQEAVRSSHDQTYVRSEAHWQQMGFAWHFRTLRDGCQRQRPEGVDGLVVRVCLHGEQVTARGEMTAGGRRAAHASRVGLRVKPGPDIG